jgi:integrase
MPLTNLELKKALKDAKECNKDIWLSDNSGARVGWLLQFRASPTGRGYWYFRYTETKGIRKTLALDQFPSLSLVNARNKAFELSKIYKEDRNLKAALKEREEKIQKLRLDAENKKMEDERQLAINSSATLEKLMDTYVEYLISKEKLESASSARRVFKAHASSLKNSPVNKITKKDITNILRVLIENGKGRTAGVLRSYISAAYNLAINVEDDPEIPATFMIFLKTGLSHNPASETKPLTKYINARSRVLSRNEFKALWKRLGSSGFQGTVLQIAIALGGQRIAQLLRVTVNDVSDDGIITLRDPKGKRSTPRLHSIPLTGISEEMIFKLLDRAKALNSPWLFSCDGNKKMHPNTLTHLIADISDQMLKENEINTPFQMRDLRRTIETTFAELNISKDHRAQIQSHGLNGVQDKFYDKHDYLKEKTTALQSLSDWITNK